VECFTKNIYSSTSRAMWPETYITHPTVTSKMLLPTEEDTAMSPKPFLATITLVMRSGMEVPAARNVNPITCNVIEVVVCNPINY